MDICEYRGYGIFSQNEQKLQTDKDELLNLLNKLCNNINFNKLISIYKKNEINITFYNKSNNLTIVLS